MIDICPVTSHALAKWYKQPGQRFVYSIDTNHIDGGGENPVTY